MAKTREEKREIALRAVKTGKMANTLAKALAKRYAKRWQFIDFLGPNGRESAGIVDILAIRKSGKSPSVQGLKSLDVFDIILIQVKGGSARKPTTAEIQRLRTVSEYHNAQGIVLFTWKNKQESEFSKLGEDGQWIKSSASSLFGK